MLDAITRNHANLHQRTLPNLFAKLSDAQLRARPRPETNSIAWNIWHLLRIEDITLNRFVALTPQLYTSAGWQERLGIAYGDMGTAMAIGDVDALSQTINLSELANYATAVGAQSTLTLQGFDMALVGQKRPEAHMRAVIAGEKVCAPAIVEGVIKYWGNLTIEQYVVDYCVLHPSLHVGEIGVLAGLQGAAL